MTPTSRRHYYVVAAAGKQREREISFYGMSGGEHNTFPVE